MEKTGFSEILNLPVFDRRLRRKGKHLSYQTLRTPDRAPHKALSFYAAACEYLVAQGESASGRVRWESRRPYEPPSIFPVETPDNTDSWVELPISEHDVLSISDLMLNRDDIPYDLIVVFVVTAAGLSILLSWLA